ncbi:HAMP domain-containing protein [bacterium]|nr:HAMP domain-containing protein [bacterium]
MMKRRFGLIKNFSIPARLRLAGIITLLGVVATFLAGYIGLEQSDHGLTQSVDATRAVLASMDGDMSHDALRADVLNAVINGPEALDQVRQQILTDITNHASRFAEDMATLHGLPLDDKVAAVLAKTQPLVDAYLAAAKSTGETALKDREAGRTALPRFLDIFSQLEAQLGQQGELIESEGKAAGDAAKAQNQQLIQIVMLASAVAAAVLVGSNILLSRSITKPLTRVRDAIKEVAVGNLGGRHSAFDRVSDLKDEVSEIAVFLEELRVRLRHAIEMEAEIKRTQQDQEAVVQALSVGLDNLSSGNLAQSITQPFPEAYEGLRHNYNTSVERLNHTITQVVKASGGIRSKSDEIGHAAEDLARRTENQAATLEETAAALDELTASVRSAANSAREVEAIVQNARREAEDSGKIVLGAVDAMNGIEKSSDQISQIIGVIDDIAFQTNLLALNAGVEAARAGDAGRGFAVVASEVRALAQRSSDASKEIKTLISTSSQLVGRGVAAVGSAGTALTTMVERVTHISTLVSEISSGAQEQSIGLGEVNVGVNQLDQVAQQNAAMVEQSLLATQSLREAAIGLDGLVTHFKTTEEARPMQSAPRRLRAAG